MQKQENSIVENKSSVNQVSNKKIQQSHLQPNHHLKQKNDKKSKSYSINHKKSSHIVNDNLINTLNPKRTSLDLTAFIQVFRKKVRQTTIARQFQNSLQKFKSLSQNRTINYNRQKGGFVGSYKKQNQLLVQNNRVDNKIKKIIISDLQFKERKIRQRLNFSQGSLLQKCSRQSNLSHHTGQKISKLSRRKVLTYSQTEINEESQHKTISFSRMLYDQEKINPQQIKNLDYNQNLYHENQMNYQQNSKKSSSIFTNRRLQTIASYQRPNLMYNLSLYRKKSSFNVLKAKRKTIDQIQSKTQK